MPQNILKIYNGRSSFWQWDVNQKLTASWLQVGDKIHITNGQQKEAPVLQAYKFEGTVVVDVPNIMLQEALPISAYRYIEEDEGVEYTATKFVFTVRQRPRPDSYVYTETEVLTYHALDERIKYLEENGVGGGGAQDFVYVGTWNNLEELALKVTAPDKLYLTMLEQGFYIPKISVGMDAGHYIAYRESEEHIHISSVVSDGVRYIYNCMDGTIEQDVFKCDKNVCRVIHHVCYDSLLPVEEHIDSAMLNDSLYLVELREPFTIGDVTMPTGYYLGKWYSEQYVYELTAVIPDGVIYKYSHINYTLTVRDITDNDEYTALVQDLEQRINATIGDVEENKTVVEMIAEAQEAATYDDTALLEQVSNNTEALAILNGSDEGSVDSKIIEAINQVYGGIISVSSFAELWAIDAQVSVVKTSATGIKDATTQAVLPYDTYLMIPNVPTRRLMSLTNCNIYQVRKTGERFAVHQLNETITVDQIYTSDSANPQSGIAVAEALGTVDVKIDEAIKDIELTPGPEGQPGADGQTPYINDNGNWQIGDTDTGVKAEGVNGAKGDSAYDTAVKNGFVGNESEWLESLKGSQGQQGIQGEKGEQGEKGNKGDDGVGITKVENINNNLIITLSDGNEINFGNIKGDKGDPATNIVQSVNGQTGEVKLSASDVGALSESEGTNIKEQIQTINNTLTGLEELLASI